MELKSSAPTHTSEPGIERSLCSRQVFVDPLAAIINRCRQRCFIDMLNGVQATKKAPKGLFIDNLAEAVRFELTEGSHPRRFSRPVHSTALPSFRVEIQAIL